MYAPSESMMRKLPSENSLITCRQAPQGQQGAEKSPSELPAIAIAIKALLPSETALNIAVRSAQFPSG